MLLIGTDSPRVHIAGENSPLAGLPVLRASSPHRRRRFPRLRKALQRTAVGFTVALALLVVGGAVALVILAGATGVLSIDAVTAVALK